MRGLNIKLCNLRKEKGGIGLLCIQDYYYAAHLRPVICLYTPTYIVEWKEIEGRELKEIPITSL